MDVLDIFKKITSIPHCSEDTSELKNFILNFAKRNGFKSEVDEAGNILCYKNKRDICLQSHYDMVCIGKAPDIEIIEDNGYLKAKESSLGADNGIGVAVMLYLISKNIEAEYLFTNDEEIGLIGANELDLKIKSKYMLNLDSEELGSVFIGCAGGVDIFASKRSIKEKITKNRVFKIESMKFPGGHSGVDIDKDIPNAIKEMAKFLSNIKDFELLYFRGGERINSIASFAKAIVASDKDILKNHNFKVKEVEKKQDFFIKNGKNLVNFLATFPHGVRECDFELKIPKTSINLAIVNLNLNELDISLSARSMDNEKLKILEDETKLFFETLGFKTRSEGKYPAWKPKITEFAKFVKNIYEKYEKNVEFKAIHAGLESAIIASKFPNIEIVSIGPNIYNPHSTKERVEIRSVKVFTKVVEDIIKSI